MKRREFLGAGSIAGAALLGVEKIDASDFQAKNKLEVSPMAFTVPPLPYSFDALEPYIDAKTMEIHHDKHHGAYVNNVNKALDGHADLQAKSIDELLKNLDGVPEVIRGAVRNNGSRHWNHSLFWTLMKKGGGGEPKAIWGRRLLPPSVPLLRFRKSSRPRAPGDSVRAGLADRKGRQAGG
jgi:Fe-Mn family superoxide dismutase